MSMENRETKIALAMIVKGSKEEADSLSTCLSRTASYVDGIFITITHLPGEERNKDVEDVAKTYGAIISDYEWTYNFAAARNYNFSQVPKEFTHIMWLDADDVVRGLDRLIYAVETHPKVDGFVLHYLYAFDENKSPIVVHMKTQVVRNDGCVVWRGELHEDFAPTRELETYFVKGAERIHLSNDARFDSAKERNLEISKKQAEKAPDDPRSYWNLGNSFKAMGMEQDALSAFDEFLARSLSEEEKYIVRLRRAECFWALDKRREALDETRYAIGLRPEYPDAYNLAGSLNLEMGRFEESVKMFLQGLMKKPPYTSILVFNPRDYDWTPMKNLAKAYFSLNRPDMALPLLKGCLKIVPNDEKMKELVKIMSVETRKFNQVIKEIERLAKIKDKKKLKEEMDALPKWMRSHPGICNLRNVNFVKEESSGRDLVYFCSYTEEVWNPDTAKKKGIGGSEEAVIHLSSLLADRGWNVTVYANCGPDEKKYGKVVWRPYWMWNTRDKQDVTILWRSPKMASHEINSKKIIVDLHDVISAGEFNEERLKRIDKVFVKSQFHKSLFPTVPEDKFVVVSNGIDPEIFAVETERNPKLLVNTSSPDRSLSGLIDCVREIRKEVPDVQVKWAYGWGVFDTVAHSNDKLQAWKTEMQRQMKEVGIEELGRVSHSEVAKLCLNANVFAYPSEFAEIDCISLSKALAAGAIPVTTDFSAMGEKQKYGGFYVHSDKNQDNWALPYQTDFALKDRNKQRQWIDYVIKLLKQPPSEDVRQGMRKKAQADFDWKKVADVWHNILWEQ